MIGKELSWDMVSNIPFPVVDRRKKDDLSDEEEEPEVPVILFPPVTFYELSTFGVQLH